jgi:hypothetical protein
LKPWLRPANLRGRRRPGRGGLRDLDRFGFSATMTVYCIGSANGGAVVGQTHAVTTRGIFGTIGIQDHEIAQRAAALLGG